jgi:hypothetical protein
MVAIKSYYKGGGVGKKEIYLWKKYVDFIKDNKGMDEK